jgi:hypothetical protein
VYVFGEKRAGKSSFINMACNLPIIKENINFIEYDGIETGKYLEVDFGVMVMKIGAITAETIKLYSQFGNRLPVVLFLGHCEFEDGNAWYHMNKEAFTKLGKFNLITASFQ